MKNAARRKSDLTSVLTGIFFLVAAISFGQKKSDQLQAEQSRLEEKLNNTKSLLEKVQSGTKSSLNEIKLIDNQVKYREELVQNFDNQIRGAELSISSKDAEVKALRKRLERMRNQYKKLLLYAYKHRNRHGKMMYVFSASNYFEAVKRSAYLKRLAEMQRKQFRLIRQSQNTITKEIGQIKNEKQKKEVLLGEKIQEKDKILKDKQEHEKKLATLKQDEQKLMNQLKADQKQKEILKRRIKEAIEKEIAESEAKAKKEQKAAANKKKAVPGGSKPPTTPEAGASPGTGAAKKEIELTETKEEIAMGKSFESNRGKLPWPVAKGTITEAYGKNPHPTLANVFTNNNGVDIGAPKNASVRAVFEGEVSSILNIAGAGKCVIIKHGNYRTVYSNLQDVYVSVGTKVTTKQPIGALLPDTEGSLSTVHFEVYQITDAGVSKMNPSLWLTK